ncbi:GAF domain-containing sensor histidine kinase [Neiella marina]|uniref:histidine kinase n=1 Tax=Neiella holothuriorum TaxID=2870530 RepID=A0ABS7EJ47_9GAMM|nr:GAF domain-containing sensor histidine kinase [Neiella holothuriorum]MBW8191786.1 GAF domain-containing sensor histidine kinase [Neiella holothuriorum]
MRDELETILLQVSKSPDIDEGSLDNASRLIVDSVCEGLQITRAGIWLLQDESAHISCALLIDKGNNLDHESLKLSRVDFPEYFAALDTERSIAAHDAKTDPATFEFADVYLGPLGISSMLDVPIRHRGRMIGIICCEHQGEQRTWQPDELVFASSLADLYGRAVSAKERADYQQLLLDANQNLEQKVKERTHELQSTLETLRGAQDKLVEAEKMAALGNLVAGVAHEVNTPLGIALTSVSHCWEELLIIKKAYDQQELTEQALIDFLSVSKDGLRMAEDNLVRAAQLIQDFKRTAADQTSNEREEIDLGSYVGQVINPLKPMLRKQQIHLDVELPIGTIIETYPGIIAQLVTNLISNVQRHAFPKTYTTARNELVVSCGQHEQECFVAVADNGIGIAPDLHKKVFEPFYTTARDAGGTGLGLPIFYNLVTQKLQGRIELSSEPDHGTTFTIWFPAQN